MSPTTYGEVLARNIRAARSRADLSQEDLAERMQHLGYSAWLYQTVGNVERGKRRVTAEELLGLALCLEVSIPALTTAHADHDGFIQLPSVFKLGAISVERLAGRGVNDHTVQWPDGGNAPWVAALIPPPGMDPFDMSVVGPAMAEQGLPEDAEVPPAEQIRPRDD
jgi:transcriptional regulator with XRE-family HTH domain